MTIRSDEPDMPGIVLCTHDTSLTAALQQAQYGAIIIASTMEMLARVIQGNLAQIILVCDDAFSVRDIERIIQAARADHARTVRIALISARPDQRPHLVSLASQWAVPLCPTSMQDSAAVIAWIANQFSFSRRWSSRRAHMLAVGVAKGGSGKTVITTLLAETIRRRGWSVLVVDSDIANPGLSSRYGEYRKSLLYCLPSVSHIPLTVERVREQVVSVAAQQRDGWGSLGFLPSTMPTAIASHLTSDMTFNDWTDLYTILCSGLASAQELSNETRDSHSLPSSYDVVIIDTPPDYTRRPYGIHTLVAGGSLIMPTMIGKHDRVGARNLTHYISATLRDSHASVLDRCFQILIEPERGSVVPRMSDVIAEFREHAPFVRQLGVLPREPEAISRADQADTYTCPFDVPCEGARRLEQAMHAIVDELAKELSWTLPLPPPTFDDDSSLWKWMPSWVRRLTARNRFRIDPTTVEGETQ